MVYYIPQLLGINGFSGSISEHWVHWSCAGHEASGWSFRLWMTVCIPISSPSLSVMPQGPPSPLVFLLLYFLLSTQLYILCKCDLKTWKRCGRHLCMVALVCLLCHQRLNWARVSPIMPCLWYDRHKFKINLVKWHNVDNIVPPVMESKSFNWHICTFFL